MSHAGGQRRRCGGVFGSAAAGIGCFTPNQRRTTMFNVKAAVAAVALALAGTAFAQTTTPNPAATPGIDKRQANQEKRIEQGVKSGELNKKETARLEKREAKLQSDKEKAQADGKVTKKERKQLNHEANRDSKAIYRQKHDAQKAKK
jgi:hypothetical protein